MIIVKLIHMKKIKYILLLCLVLSSTCEEDKNAGNILTHVSIELQPGPEIGKDAWLSFLYPDKNYGTHKELSINAWTVNGEPCKSRQVIEFDLSEIPVNSRIKRLILFLYNTPYSSNGYKDGNHVPVDSSNHGLIQRVISPWDELTVTWNTMPLITEINQIRIPGPTDPNQNYELDVTNIVQDMVNDPENSYGFMLKLENEIYYRIIVLASSDCPDSTLWPKLFVNYIKSTPNTP